MLHRFLASAFLVLCCVSGEASAQPAVGAGEPGALGVVVTLAAEEPVTLGLGSQWSTLPVRLTLPEGVHVYWLNPGEAGMRTTVGVTLPEGWQRRTDSTRDALLPPPERFASAGVIGFGYAEEVVAVANFPIAHDVAEGEAGVAEVEVRYLACDADRCVPGVARFPVRVVAGAPRRSVPTPAEQQVGAAYDRPEKGLVTLAEPEAVSPDAWSFPLPGVPAGATDVGFFAFPRDSAEPFGEHDALRTIEGVPEAEPDGEGGWRITAEVTAGPRGHLRPDIRRPWTLGLVGYTLGGERRGIMLAVAQPQPQPAAPALP